MKKLLIVVNMQKDFIDGSLGTKEAQSIVGKVCEKIKTFDGDIVYTMDTHPENYLSTQEGTRLPVRHCITGTDGWQLNKRVEDALKERGAYEKRYMKGTFGSTLLAEDLQKEYALEKIVIVGLCTDICVISNALLLKAFMPEIQICVDGSCCAGVTPESHENALCAMKMCQIDIE